MRIPAATDGVESRGARELSRRMPSGFAIALLLVLLVLGAGVRGDEDAEGVTTTEFVRMEEEVTESEVIEGDGWLKEERIVDGTKKVMEQDSMAEESEAMGMQQDEEGEDQRAEADTRNSRAEQRRNSTRAMANRTETGGFMPSFHLGPIGVFPTIQLPINQQEQQPQTTTTSTTTTTTTTTTRVPNAAGQPQPAGTGQRSNSPFNSLRPIKFGSDRDDQAPRQTLQKPLPPFRPSDKDENYVKFEDDFKDGGANRHYHNEGVNCHKSESSTNQRHGEPGVHQVAYPEVQQVAYPEAQQVVTFQDENYDNGLQQQYVGYESKPSKFHQDANGFIVPYQQSLVASENHYQPYHQQASNQHHEAYHDDKLLKPDTVINVHPISYQAATFDGLNKPKTVVYVTTHETTRTRKFPHYYQPQIYDHTEPPQLALPEHEEPYQYPLLYEQQKSISPWKKILHIIGAFLPLGLLFALLSPRVITANQNTEPNIVLSKLRVNDLPAEHKRPIGALDIDDGQPCSEERSICRLLAGGDPASSAFLSQLLLHITERTPESAVRKKELDRIFEAAKLGNCDILTCNFYDGT